MTDSPAPVASQTTHKAWAAGIAAAVAPYVIGNLVGASDSFSTIWDYAACHAFGTACPPPDLIAGACKAIGAAVVGGMVAWYAAYKMPNRALPAPNSASGA